MVPVMMISVVMVVAMILVLHKKKYESVEINYCCVARGNR